jgi:peroxiredoxin Q/BCP
VAYGKAYWGSSQTTSFILDDGGSVRHTIPKASPKTHDDEVLAALRDLPAAA